MSKGQNSEQQNNEQKGNNGNGGDQNGGKDFYNFRPNIELFADLSKDGRFFIFKVAFTFIKPRKYLETILRNFFKTQAQKPNSTMA